MSGGSFDYLYAKDAEEIMTHEDELQQMFNSLAAFEGADDAAAETAELIQILRQYRIRANVIIRRLADVWQSVEWWTSNDAGKDSVQYALAQYRNPKEA